MADNEFQPASAPYTGAGGRLQAAREAAGMTLAQISAQSRIPVRMLALIEAGNFSALPGRTYATGFTRSYARVVGLDEAQLAAMVRHELGLGEQPELRQTPDFEPGDPVRVPTARFAWLTALVALLIIAAGLVWWRTYYLPAVSLPPLLQEPTAEPPLQSDLPLSPLSSGEPATMGAATGEIPAVAATSPAAPMRAPRPSVRRPQSPSPAVSGAAVPLEVPVASAAP